MKTMKSLLVLAAVASLVFASCSNPFTAKAKAGTGTLRISVGSSAKALKAARTIAPAVDHYAMHLLPHADAIAAGGAAIDQANLADFGAPITLVVGTWDLTLDAMDAAGIKILAEGTATVTIAAGVNVVEVAMNPMLTTSGSGSLSATFSWPSGYTTDAIFSLQAYPTPLGELVGTTGVTIATDATGPEMAQIKAASLPSGTYYLSLDLMNGAALQARIGNIVQIYDGTLSAKTTTLSISDMTQDSPPPAPFNARIFYDGAWHLVWDDPSGQALGYRVMHNNSDIWETLPASSGTAWNLSAAPGEGDVFYVAAYNRGGESAPATAYFYSINSVTITPSAATIAAAGNLPLSASVSTAGPYNAVTWSSSNPSVASVDQSGLVSGIAPGTATITATSLVDQSKSGTSAITVSP